MHPVNLADALMAMSLAQPDKPAVIEAGVSLTRSQFMDLSARWRTVLAGTGIGSGDRIGVACQSELDSLAAYVGLWLLNAAPVPMDFRSRRAERTKYARSFSLKTIIETRTPPGEGEYPAICVDDSWRKAIADAIPEYERHCDDGDHPAFIALTSGTTGKPQGFLQSHHCFYLRYTNVMTCKPNFGYGERYLSLMPMHFGGARAIVIYALLDGATIQFHGPLFTANEVVETIRRDRVSSTWMVPSVLQEMMSLADGVAPLLPDLEVLQCGGATVSPDIKREVRKRLCPGFIEIFAATAPGSITSLYGADLETHAETVGRPFRHVLAEIVDPDGTPLPRNEVGRLRVRSPGMPSGVIRDSGSTIQPVEGILDGWAYSGDLAAITEDGFLRLAGRVSDIIIRSGANILPKEIESTLIQHAAVRDVCVVGVPSESVGEEIVAIIESDSPQIEPELAALCSRELSPYKRPRMFKFVDRIPRNELGKLPKTAVMALLRPPEQPST